jgi:hypothetical protein
MSRQSYEAERALLTTKHPAAERAMAASGHRSVVWGRTFGKPRSIGTGSVEDRNQIGYCACRRARVEITTFEEITLDTPFGSRGMRLFGTGNPCSAALLGASKER